MRPSGASSTRKPLPCAPLSLGSRRALRLHANAIVFLVINRISELRRGHPAAAAIASLASENAVSISKIRCICCEFRRTARKVSLIKRTRTSRTCALVFHLITSKASPICLPWLPQGRWRCAERVSANTSRMSGVFSLRTAFILAHAQGRCASSTRNIRHLFGL